MGQGSDAGSVNGDEVDRSGLPLRGSAPRPSVGPLSPTGSCSSLGGVPRCQSPAPSDPFPSGSSLLSNGSHISGSVSSLDSDASGSTVTSTDSHTAGHRGGHHDASRSRRLEAEARKAEKRSRFRSPDRQEREAVLSPERRSVTLSFKDLIFNILFNSVLLLFLCLFDDLAVLCGNWVSLINLSLREIVPFYITIK